MEFVILVNSTSQNYHQEKSTFYQIVYCFSEYFSNFKYFLDVEMLLALDMDNFPETHQKSDCDYVSSVFVHNYWAN